MGLRDTDRHGSRATGLEAMEAPRTVPASGDGAIRQRNRESAVPALARGETLRSLSLVASDFLWAACVFAFIWLLVPETSAHLAVPREVGFLGLAIYALGNLFRRRVLGSERPGVPLAAKAFVGVDLLAIGAAVAVTGGASSPFMLFFFIVVMQSAVVHGRVGGLVAGLLSSVSCALGIVAWERLTDAPQPSSTAVHLLHLTVFVSIGVLLGAHEEMRQARGKAASSCCESLTPRERMILRMVVEGKTNKEVASTIGRNEKTVRNIVSSILKKCGASSRFELAEACRPCVDGDGVLRESSR